MLTIDQIATRRLGIGGSDIGAILGLNKYKTPLDVFMEKTGRIPPADLSDNQRVHFGNVLEDVVADEYARRTNTKVRRRRKTFKHKKYAWMLAHIDRSVDLEKKILECKAADAWTYKDWGENGTDHVPDPYLVQVHWYMPILDYDLADLAVLIGGNDFRIYNFERDKALENMLIRKGDEFWNDYVLRDIPPEPVSVHDLETMYAHDNGKSILADADTEDSVHILKNLKAQRKQIDQQIEDAEFSIKKFIGENAELLYGSDGRKLATWKNDRDGIKLDVEAFKRQMPALYKNYCEPKKGIRRFLLKVK